MDKVNPTVNLHDKDGEDIEPIANDAQNGIIIGEQDLYTPEQNTNLMSPGSNTQNENVIKFQQDPEMQAKP